ncbi:hypothetical protein [Sediminibacillus massiliensis]|uniref:hypothetical protein n=1 Tax=Sediminibacillus massiliensis TaxID=1926277 RepID=UPI0009887FE7|nr:hypothetical protein [Sediminibacillus massiliensis]
MTKRVLVMLLVFLLVGGGTVYMLAETTEAKLKEPVKVHKEQDDFILHVRAEEREKGFQVLRSLEYRGNSAITVEHRTPLISASVDREGHDFTGSPVQKELKPGNIYYPQGEKVFESPGKGSYTLYIKCQFFVDGELNEITAEREIIFE